MLDNINAIIYNSIKQFNGNKLTAEIKADDGVLFAGAKWCVKTESEISENVISYTVTYTPDAAVEGISVTSGLKIDEWKLENYVLFPAAAYDGNRFPWLEMEYPPIMTKEYFYKPLKQPYITDVPKLSDTGDSDMEFVAGDLSMPAMGIYFKDLEKGVIITTSQKTEFGENGLNMRERNDVAFLEVAVPCVKNQFQYEMCNSTRKESEYSGISLKANQCIKAEYKVRIIDIKSIQELFDTFFDIRYEEWGREERKNELPFSEAWKIYENTLNQYLWNSTGYYRCQRGSEPIEEQYDWVTGWCGGAMNTLSVLAEGNDQSRGRAIKTLDYLVDFVQAESGFFHGMARNQIFYGDNFNCKKDKNFVLARGNADALYFLLKQTEYFRLKGIPQKDNWISGAKRCADAFCRLWQNHGEFRQFIDIEEEKPIVCGTSSAVMAIGALALAYSVFKEEKYIDAAKESAEYYYDNYLKKGLTYGGPGEALQVPDSESAYAFVESYVILYEITKDKKFLKYAQDAVAQFASWVMPYNFDFPKECEFGRLGIHTVGSVFANIQNKHSAPAIATMSGDSLLKLYRYTNDEKYIELLADISHNMMQYYSRNDKPIHSWDDKTLPEGYMCERVNTSDWEGKKSIGGVFLGICWCTNCGGLVYAELPGLYVRSDLKKLWVIDHIEAEFEGNSIKIYNPCNYKARVKVLIESEDNMAEGISAAADFKTVEINSKDTVMISY